VLGRDRVQYKRPEDIRAMRRAGLVVAAAHEAVRGGLRPGVTTAELDALAADAIAAAGATPSFLGYHGFPATTCLSVNDEVVHGIPGRRELRPGDVVSVDCGAVVEGWHGDAAFTAVLDPVGEADAALSEATREAMWAGIAALATGERVGDVGAAVEDSVAGRYAIVEGYVGHGIGTAMHQPPEVLNHRSRDRGPRLRPGLCVAVEPMLTRGGAECEVLDDDWTVVTADGSRAAHWEHTVALHDTGIWVLTAPDGGTAGLAPHGVVPVPLG
jgi:methionyl aminopeptidase